VRLRGGECSVAGTGARLVACCWASSLVVCGSCGNAFRGRYSCRDDAGWFLWWKVRQMSGGDAVVLLGKVWTVGVWCRSSCVNRVRCHFLSGYAADKNGKNASGYGQQRQ
jgi:hypothetical protein